MKKLILFLFILSFQSQQTRASHAIGGEITYKCLGSNQYQIVFKFYRDCSGIPAPSVMDIQVTNSCGYTVADMILLPTPTSPIQISPVCPSALTTCNGGTFTGIEEWVYSGTVVLPGACSDWTFSHSESARNSSITTISPSGVNLFIYTMLNNMNGICDDSPVFSNRPVPFLCVGQQFCFNNGASDLQDDSLAYQIITPRIGPNSSDTVSYIFPYSTLQPMLSSPAFTLNNATGEMCMTPVQSDVTPIAVLVSAYRNGVLIGQVERDIQFTILPCNNQLPVQTGINGSPVFSFTGCVNQQNCFFITAIDADALNTTQFDWDNSVLNMTVQYSGGNRDTAFFCWTPTIADTMNGGTHYFTVTVKDDNCPYRGIVVNTYSLVVDTSTNCISTDLHMPETSIDLKIFPQPASGRLRIESKAFINSNNLSICITDITGRTIFQLPVNSASSDLDVHTMNGIYILSILDKTGLVLKKEKFIVIRH